MRRKLNCQKVFFQQWALLIIIDLGSIKCVFIFRRSQHSLPKEDPSHCRYWGFCHRDVNITALCYRIRSPKRIANRPENGTNLQSKSASTCHDCVRRDLQLTIIDLGKDERRATDGEIQDSRPGQPAMRWIGWDYVDYLTAAVVNQLDWPSAVVFDPDKYDTSYVARCQFLVRFVPLD